jgi:hypothetical protein
MTINIFYEGKIFLTIFISWFQNAQYDNAYSIQNTAAAAKITHLFLLQMYLPRYTTYLLLPIFFSFI